MAMQKLRTRFDIDVGPEEIAKGIRGNSSKCVASRGVARVVKDARNISTDVQTIRFTVGDTRLVYLTPFAVQRYVADFDEGLPIEPFRFRLRDPHITAIRKSPRTTDQIRLDYADTPSVAVKSHKRTPPIPGGKPGKRPARAYGHRLLRINQVIGPNRGGAALIDHGDIASDD